MRCPLLWVRWVALALAACAVILAGMRWLRTDQFLANAQRVQGTILATGDGRATIGFPAGSGQQLRFTADGVADAAPGASVPVAYVAAPGRPVDARLATPHALWAGMWNWVEVAVGCVLAAIYGRALIEDPSSVIAFKSWRLVERRKD